MATWISGLLYREHEFIFDVIRSANLKFRSAVHVICTWDEFLQGFICILTCPEYCIIVYILYFVLVHQRCYSVTVPAWCGMKTCNRHYWSSSFCDMDFEANGFRYHDWSEANQLILLYFLIKHHLNMQGQLLTICWLVITKMSHKTL